MDELLMCGARQSARWGGSMCACEGESAAAPPPEERRNVRGIITHSGGRSWQGGPAKLACTGFPIELHPCSQGCENTSTSSRKRLWVQHRNDLWLLSHFHWYLMCIYCHQKWCFSFLHGSPDAGDPAMDQQGRGCAQLRTDNHGTKDASRC